MGARAQVLLVALAALLLGACGSAEGEPQDADAYFLWAGVPAPEGLEQAAEVYVLSGEVRAAAPDRFVPLRPQPPRVQGPDIWLVVRTETLDWSEGVYQRIERELAVWDGSTRLVGLQVDFDSGTRGLDRYGDFLRDLRERLPPRYRLSVTGLLDWSANGDPDALAGLAGVTDEVVIQTYQGRSTIPGYERYLTSVRRLPFDYRIGIVEDGAWREPEWLDEDPHYRGTVVFLVNPEG